MSYHNPIIEAKRQRMNFVRGMLDKMGETDLDEFIAIAEINTHVSKKTIRGYIQTLQCGKFAEIKNGKIRPIRKP